MILTTEQAHLRGIMHSTQQSTVEKVMPTGQFAQDYAQHQQVNG